MGYSTADFLSIVQEVAGRDVETWLAETVTGTGELDYQAALDHFGLRFKPVGEPSMPALGITTKSEAGRLTVQESWHIGLSPGDEILGVNGYRVLPEHWAKILENHRVGETIAVLIARDEKLREVHVTLVPDPGNQWSLERVAQKHDAYEHWVSGSVSSGTLPKSSR